MNDTFYILKKGEKKVGSKRYNMYLYQKNMKELIEDQKAIIAKIDEIKKRALPHGYCIDLDALENVSIGSKNIKPSELIDLLYDSGVLITRGGAGITKIDDFTQLQLSLLYNQLIDVCQEIQNEYISKSENNNYAS